MVKEATKGHTGESEGTTWCIRGLGSPTHPYLLHLQADKNSRCGERLIGLDWILPSSDLYAQPICHRW